MIMHLAIAAVFFLGLASGEALAADVAAGHAAAKEHGCLNCHDGARNPGMIRSSGIPYLAGQHEKYLRRQMEAFRNRATQRSGGIEIAERHHPIMEMRASTLTDDEMDDIAVYYARRPCAKRTTDEVPRPKAAKRCAFCHGETGLTPFINYPKLAGQKEDYLATQLRAMRDAAENVPARNRRFHRLMAPQVVDLGDAEIDELALYFAAQRCF